ncbi:MAG TPA: PKD domain-containing protein [Candidatus Hydrogenedentes bacterium]|nr:PKD domain-containing protein [Candidatus Hydrogenedentota bacterium]
MGSLFVFLVVFLANSSAWGATYYVDAVNGNDTRAGTSPANAWKTLSKVNMTSFQPGDVILLKRDNVWRERLLIAMSGTSALPITYGAYGTGADPVLNGADVITSWTSQGGNRYTATITKEPEVVVFDGVKGNRVDSAASVDSLNDWFWTGNTLTIYSAGTPQNVEVSARQFVVEIFTASYINVINLTIQYAEDGIRLYDSNGVTLENMTVKDSAGYGGIILCAVTAGKGTNNTIRQCTVSRISGSTDSMAGGGYGHGIFIWGQDICSHNTLAGNIVHDNGGAGLLIIDSSDNLISENTAYRHGISGISISGLNSSGNVIEKNNVYENCLLENDRFGVNLYMAGNNNRIRYNLIHDQHVFTDEEVGIPGFTARSGAIRFDGDTYIGVPDKIGNQIYSNLILNEYEGIQIFNFSNVDVFNNTICNVIHSGIYMACYNVPGSGNNNTFRNNIVAQSQQQLVRNSQATNSIFDYNVYFPDGSAAFEWNGSKTNFASWRSATGQDSHSQVANPGFVDPLTGDFHLASGSPCIDIGAFLGAGEVDIAGVMRPQGLGIDIGAYEFGQAPTASFSASPLSGSKPLTVYFTDTSASGTSPITAWSWDFTNDGIPDSAEQHPSFIYAADGKYTVSLTVTNGMGSNTRTEVDLINVTSGPSADFSAAPISGIAPLSVTFTDLSLDGGSPIVTWSWDFNGDGLEDSALQHPQYDFAAGVYTVSLTVQTLDGQTDTRTKAGYITADVLPTAEFSADLTSGFTPLTVHFTDLSSPGTRPITGWNWNFGDGTPSSSVQHPTHIYTTAGSFAVTLTVTTAAGPDSETKPDYLAVQLGIGPAASFEVDMYSGNAPLAVQFTDTSTPGTSPITSWLWDFGDSTSSTEQHPQHTYENAGDYVVHLTVTTLVGSNTAPGFSSIHVNPTQQPIAAFTADVTTGQAPLSVHFTDQSESGSEPITAWFWDFGDGSSGDVQHPVHLYNAPGVYTVSLTVTTAIGSNTFTHTGYIHVFTVIFVDKDNASGIHTGSSWATAFTKIQDGIDAAANAGIPEVWVAEGNYREARTDANGALVLRANVHLYGGFSGLEIQREARNWLTHVTSIDGSIARNGNPAYHVVTGANTASLDGFIITGGRADNGNLSRDRGAGLYNAGVSPTVIHCTFTNNAAQYCGGAIYNGNGSTPLISACRFIDNTATATYFTQGFGGAIYNNNTSPTIVNCTFFNNKALAALTASGYGGAIYNQSASPSIVNCSFSNNSTTGVLFSNGAGGGILNYGGAAVITNCILWDDFPNEIRNQNSANPSVNYCDIQDGYSSGTGNRDIDPQFLEASAGNLELPSTSPCIDQGTATGAPAADILGMLRPQGMGVDMGAYEFSASPQAAFTAAPVQGYAPLSVTCTDLSLPGTSPITGWEWTFGDGDSSTEQSPTHIFEEPGAYTIHLTVTTLLGSDQADPLEIMVQSPPDILPVAAFSVSSDHGYAPFTVACTDLSAPGSSPITEWIWIFGDGGTSNDQNPSHTFLSPGAYTVSLTVTTSAGSDTAEPIIINAVPPLHAEIQPQEAAAYVGGHITFSVITDGGWGEQQYDWWFEGTAPPAKIGGNTSVLIRSPLTQNEAGIYWCEVHDEIGSCSTLPATLSVYEHLAMETPPAGASVMAGGSYTFSVTTTGGIPPLDYLWKRNGVEVPKTSGDSLTLDYVSQDDAGLYSVDITDSGTDAVSSEEVMLEVVKTTPVLSWPGIVFLMLAMIAFRGIFRLKRAKND